MFEDSALIEQAKTLLLSLPADKKVALVAVVNNKSANVIFAFKPSDEWSIQSYVELKEHNFTYGASLVYSK